MSVTTLKRSASSASAISWTSVGGDRTARAGGGKRSRCRGVADDGGVESEIERGAGGRADAHVGHEATQHKSWVAQAFDRGSQLSAGEGVGKGLADHRLARDRRDLLDDLTAGAGRKRPPGRPLWATWMIAVPPARAASRSRRIWSTAAPTAGRASLPSRYSCWASITTIAVPASPSDAGRQAAELAQRGGTDLIRRQAPMRFRRVDQRSTAVADVVEPAGGISTFVVHHRSLSAHHCVVDIPGCRA